jgi:hypothetical protein
MKLSVFLLPIFLLSVTAVAQNMAMFTMQDGREIDGVIFLVTDDSIYFTQPHLLHYAERTQPLPGLSFARSQVRTITYDEGTSVLATTLIGAGAGMLASGILAFSTDEGGSSLSKVFAPLVRTFIVIVGTASGAIGGLLYGLLAPDHDTTFDVSDDADYEILKASYPADTGE